uniref:PilZ domain protein n=1 Tax=uncultured bacterium CSLF42 TaxID=1091574 RepID=G4WVZ3_9BACT|nr:PilZ domain protein [uncultured bacterium CSLF42]
MTHTHERRKHSRLPLHLSVAKLVDFKCEGMDQPTPAVLIDLSAGGLAMVCFALPKLSQNVTFRLELPGLVNAQVHGRVVRAHRKGETYQVAIAFTEFQDQWAHLVEKLAKAYKSCEDRLSQGDRRFCFRDCAFFVLCQKDEKARVFPKTVMA